MNRERLTLLRDHLASLPDERVDMGLYIQVDGALPFSHEPFPVGAGENCGTVACIAGWAALVFNLDGTVEGTDDRAASALALTVDQAGELFRPRGYWRDGAYTRSDAIAAIQSMLDSPDDDALPVWPERAEAA